MNFLQEEVAAFLEYKFKKIKLLKRVEGKKEIWLVKVKSTGENAVMKIITNIDENYSPPPYPILKKISSPILSKIFYCTSDGTVCVEKFVEGKTFREIIDEKNFFDEDAAKNFLLQICEGLSVLHKNNIIHRDIKPENLILQADGKIKLIDFDIARIFKSENKTDTKKFGTYGYAAPEQFGHGQTDSRSDIYALGQTLREILGKNYHGILEKIIEKCTEYDPKRRFQSVEEIKNSLLNNKIETVKNVVDYRAIEGFEITKKVEVDDKKSYVKIFLLCASIIFLGGIFHFNSTAEEKISEEIIKTDEKNFEKENVAKVEEKVSKPTFENINLPPLAAPTNSTPNVQVTTKITLPEDFKPSFPNQENVNLSNFTPSFPENKTEKNFIMAKYFWNGSQINNWQNNLTEDAEVNHLVYIPAEIWKNNLTPINGILEINIENYSAESFKPQLEIIFNDDGNLQTKNLSGQILNSGQNYNFRINLNEFRVESLKNSLMGSAEMNIKILNANKIIGSNATINFIFVQEGFPIPKH